MIIKTVLIGSLVLAGWWILRGPARGRRLALTRLASILLTLCGVVAVLVPELVTRVANMVGVGRGTDLVLYVLVIAFVFSTLTQRLRLRDLEQRMVRLTREGALRDAQTTEPSQRSLK